MLPHCWTFASINPRMCFHGDHEALHQLQWWHKPQAEVRRPCLSPRGLVDRCMAFFCASCNLRHTYDGVNKIRWTNPRALEKNSTMLKMMKISQWKMRIRIQNMVPPFIHDELKIHAIQFQANASIGDFTCASLSSPTWVLLNRWYVVRMCHNTPDVMYSLMHCLVRLPPAWQEPIPAGDGHCR